MKKVSIGSWAYIMGAFGDNPILLPELFEKLDELGFDGVSLGGFKPHAHPDLFNTPEKRAGLKKLLTDNNMEVADFAADLWSVDSIKQNKEWLDLFDNNMVFMSQMGFKTVRIDSGAPPILPEGMSYDAAKDFVKEMFVKCAKRAAQEGIDVVWEFEPGFIVNEPKNIIEVVDDVNESNFSLLVDTCHAHMAAVEGSRNIEEGCKLDGGVVEFCEMAKDKIGLVHLIDSDGTLNETETSTHAPFGDGVMDFDVVIPALLDKARYKGDWWAIDLCEWPDAWNATARCKAFVDEINEKYCK